MDGIGGYEIILEACGGGDFFTQIESSSPIIPQIIFTDIQMTGMDGCEVVVRAKKEFPNTIIIVFSMFSHKHLVYQLMKSGANGFISKSSNYDTFRLALDKVVIEEKKLFTNKQYKLI